MQDAGTSHIQTWRFISNDKRSGEEWGGFSDFIASIIMSIHQRLSIDEIPQCWAGSSFCCDNTELGWTEPISRAKTALPSLELISRPVIRGGWGGDTSRLGLSSAWLKLSTVQQKINCGNQTGPACPGFNKVQIFLLFRYSLSRNCTVSILVFYLQ